MGLEGRRDWEEAAPADLQAGAGEGRDSQAPTGRGREQGKCGRSHSSEFQGSWEGEELGGRGGSSFLGAGEDVQNQWGPTTLSGPAVTPGLQSGKGLRRDPISTSQPLEYPAAPCQQLRVLLRDTGIHQKASPRLLGQRGTPAPRGLRGPRGCAARPRRAGPALAPPPGSCNRGRRRRGWTSPAPALPRAGPPRAASLA